MTSSNPLPIDAAEVVLPAADLDATLAFFCGRLGFRLASIFPADRPRVAVVVGHGLRLRLDAGATGPPATLRVHLSAAAVPPGGEVLVAPNGTRIHCVARLERPVLPPPSPALVVSTPEDGGAGRGRAGMSYRDLIPGRQGGRVIASEIAIEGGGPVPDYSHFHRVSFQMIYCRRGSVEVVYEDQGPPFVMEAGDSVLQPPLIRHRVLACSPGLQVIEITCPAEHETVADHDHPLPSPQARPERTFGGQRFHRHVAREARWIEEGPGAVRYRDLGIGAATGGLARARVLRVPASTALTPSPEAGLLVLYVLEGTLALARDGGPARPLPRGSAIAIPAGIRCPLTPQGAPLELLEVALPACFASDAPSIPL